MSGLEFSFGKFFYDWVWFDFVTITCIARESSSFHTRANDFQYTLTARALRFYPSVVMLNLIQLVEIIQNLESHISSLSDHQYTRLVQE
jgi:hypothetical protein